MPRPSAGTPGDPEAPNYERPTPALAALLLVFLFLYIRFRVDTSLLYLTGPGLFVLDLDFLRQFMDYPGRPARYLTLLLQELYSSPWRGALAASVLILLLGACTRALLVSTRPRGGFRFTLYGWIGLLLPALLALVSFNRYQPVDLVGIVAALLLALAYTRMFPACLPWRVPTFAGLLVLMTLLSPDMSPLLASLCALWETAGKKRWFAGLLYSIFGALPRAFVNGYFLNLDFLFVKFRAAPLLFPRPAVVPIALLTALLVVSGVAALRRRSKSVFFAGLILFLYGLQLDVHLPVQGLLCFSVALAPALPCLLPGAPPPQAWKPRGTAVISAVACLSAAFLLVALPSLDRQTRYFLRFKRSCLRRDWPAALRLAARIRPDTYRQRPVLYPMLHRALYHAGRLPYALLDFPTDRSLMLPVPMPRWDRLVREGSMETAETCLDLGLVNHAELMAYDSLEAVEKPARAYRLLARVYLLKDNPAAARPILNLLRKTLVHRRWADRYLALLDGTPADHPDPRIAHIRSVMVTTDLPEDARLLYGLTNMAWDWEAVLKKLLDVHPSNKMAFEYLMSYYLLRGRTHQVVELLPLLKRLGYREIPDLYQEALLTDSLLAGRGPETLHSWPLKPPLVQKYSTLMRIYDRLGRDPAAAYEAVARSGGSTYFAYCLSLMKHDEKSKKDY